MTCNTLEELFSFTHVYNSAKRCTHQVRWKTSTQNFEALMMSNVCQLRRDVISETYKSSGFHRFVIRERGKVRKIMSVHITERTVQKTLCDYYLIPKITPKLIYDNGACLKRKGTSFAIKRLRKHLHKYYLENGSDGYILQFDIKDFFNSINHQLLIDKMRKVIEDDKIFKLYSYFVNCFDGDTGIGLGSQISQVSASYYLNELDHLIKDKLGFKYYGRYMDDGYIICNSKEQLKECLREIKELFEKLKLTLNPKKTLIISLKHGFTYMKRRFNLKEDGYISMKPYKKNILRYKRKYKKLMLKNVEDKVLADLRQTFKGYLKEFNYVDRYTRRIERDVSIKERHREFSRQNC